MTPPDAAPNARDIPLVSVQTEFRTLMEPMMRHTLGCVECRENTEKVLKLVAMLDTIARTKKVGVVCAYLPERGYVVLFTAPGGNLGEAMNPT